MSLKNALVDNLGRSQNTNQQTSRNIDSTLNNNNNNTINVERVDHNQRQNNVSFHNQSLVQLIR